MGGALNIKSNERREDEERELGEFLDSERSPDSVMDISTLDGFLAAVALNPGLIPISDCYPWIWDMDEGVEKPEFSTPDESKHIMDLIENHYTAVVNAIRDGCFEPLFYVLSQKDDSVFYDAECWSEGFLIGVSLFIDPWWLPVMENSIEMVAPMVLLGTEDGWEMLAESDDEEAAIQGAYDYIPEAIKNLHDYFEIQRLMKRDELIENETKLSRHYLCPCGSGKEYKKCCGYQGLLH
jgi:uncharacterized protein